MIKLIIFLVICVFLGSCFSDTGTYSDTTSTSVKPNRKAAKKAIKKQQKELRRKEEDAYEDMLMYLEVFSDDL